MRVVVRVVVRACALASSSPCPLTQRQRTGGGGADGQGTDGAVPEGGEEEPTWRNKWFWFKLSLVAALVGGIVYLLIYLGSQVRSRGSVGWSVGGRVDGGS